MNVTRHHPLLVALHWLVAALVLFSLAAGALALAGAPNDAAKIAGLRVHMIVGGSILALMLARVVVRLASATPPRASTGNALLDLLARAVHLLLYLGVLLLAASGVALSIQAGLPDSVFFGRGGLPEDFWAFPARRAHYVLSRAVMVLAGLHLLGALYHALLLRDGLLARMWFGSRQAGDARR